MADYVRKVGSEEPLVATILDRAGPISLPIGTTVVCRIRSQDGSFSVNADADVVNPGAISSDPLYGKVTFVPTASTFTSEGIYRLAWLVQRPDETPAHFPLDDWMSLVILPEP